MEMYLQETAQMEELLSMPVITWDGDYAMWSDRKGANIAVL